MLNISVSQFVKLSFVYLQQRCPLSVYCDFFLSFREAGKLLDVSLTSVKGNIKKSSAICFKTYEDMVG